MLWVNVGEENMSTSPRASAGRWSCGPTPVGSAEQQSGPPIIGWHRKGFRLWWRWKSRLGRPRVAEDLRRLIVRMVRENPTWGEERVAAELSVKLGVLVSPRTVRAYW